MLSSLVDGYGSSDSGSDDNSVQKSKAPTEQSPAKPEPKSTDQFNDVEPSGAKAAAPPKRKLPSASATMAATSSWARSGNDAPPAPTDDVGTKYHNVAPPMGLRAEDGVMGGRGDYIRPVMGGSVSLDPTKAYEGTRTLAAHGAIGAPAKNKGSGPLVPPQIRGRKNINTEDTESWTSGAKKPKNKH